MSVDRPLMELSAALERRALDLRDCRQDPTPARLAAVVVDLSGTCGHLADAAGQWATWIVAAADEAAALRERGLLEGDVAAAVDRAHAGLASIAEALRSAQRTTEGVPEALTVFGRMT